MPNKDRPRSIRALECRPGAEYDEETFLHLLAMEQARAGRSSQRVRLLLATLEPVPGKPVEIPPPVAVRLFEGLRSLLRDTDIMGWYRQSHVAGAVLSSVADRADYETSGLIQQRVSEGLRRRLPSKPAGNLRVRVTHHGPRRLAKE
jgi:hypothetical protein